MSEGPEETLIFVDVDGVLNVGIRDPESKPMSFNESNMSVVRKLVKGVEEKDFADVLLSVMSMPSCDGNSSTYGDFLSRNDLDVCDIFVHRLVKILRAAGDKRRVIISSSWRRPQYVECLKSLEKIIGGYLGKRFAFDDRTDIVDESGAATDRLRLIGDYIDRRCSQRNSSKCKVLVLDDFFYAPVKDYNVGGTLIDSLESAQSYLAGRAPVPEEAEARIIQTYVNSTLPSGLQVQIGTGLSLAHLHKALSFLGVVSSESPRRTPSKTIEMTSTTFDDLSTPPEPVETLIFLDIDGVLNIGIQDPGSAPLSFNEANFSIARKLFKANVKSDIAEMLLAVMRMPTFDGDSSKYGDHLSRNDLDVCDIFVHRLVKIIRAAGSLARVVISSSWRRKKYEKNVQALEQIIGGYLGSEFKFSDGTAQSNETGAHDRIRLIGDYISGYCSKDPIVPRLRVLVLDDFFYLPVKGITCGDTAIDSIETAQSYLAARAPATTEAKVKIVHTYMSSTLESGLEVQVGTGLSLRHVGEALTFLGTEQSWTLPAS